MFKVLEKKIKIKLEKNLFWFVIIAVAVSWSFSPWLEFSVNQIKTETALAQSEAPSRKIRLFEGFTIKLVSGKMIINQNIEPEANNGLLADVAHHWKLDETSGDRVDSVGSVDLEPQNTGVDYDTGIIGNSVFLDIDASAWSEPWLRGVGGFDVTSGGDISINLWFKGGSKRTQGLIGDMHSQYRVIFDLTDSGNKLRFILNTFSSNDRVEFDVSSLIYDGNWHMLTATYGPTNQLSVWVDGDKKASVTPSGSWDISANDIYVGNFDSQFFLDGYLDSITVWDNRELDSDEISALYNSGNGLDYDDYD